jgi:UDP-N-acetylglucosamine 2-epimerase (non-hydrolysing)
LKIVTVVGARPQFIKHAPLSKELVKSHQIVLVHTGQHYDYEMSKVFFDELGIPEPDYNLGIGSGTHAYQTGEMLKGIEEILIKEKPDLTIVYGDTNSTLAGALSAAKLHVKTAHVEAGLRMFDKSYPEEINRFVADYCSDYLFCPTQTAADNLRQEGVTKGVYLTGDIMVDSLKLNKEIAEKSNILNILGLNSKQYLLVTIHRDSNTDKRQNLENIVNAIIELGNQGMVLVFPAHPRTVKMLKTFGFIDSLKKKALLVEPLGYLEFMKLLNHSKAVLTDSGGIQKEAYILKVPCITLMDNTPWNETVADGWNIMVGNDKMKIIDMAKEFNPSNQTHGEVFGKGNTSEEINKILKQIKL